MKAYIHFKKARRVYEALELAGGMTQEAQQGHINLARVLVDGESIYFPTQDEVKTIGLTWSEQTQPEDARININTASEEETNTASWNWFSKGQSDYRISKKTIVCLKK